MPITISTQPVHTPTVPSFHTRIAPNTMPKIVQLITRWRDVSSSTSTVSRASGSAVSAAASSSVTGPPAGELSDAGLDLVEVDITKLACRDDLLSLYHHVGDRARPERLD